MTVLYPKKPSSGDSIDTKDTIDTIDKRLQPVCLKQPAKQPLLPLHLKSSALVSVLFLVILLPLIPGNDPSSLSFIPSSSEESLFLPPKDERILDLISTADGGLAFILSPGFMHFIDGTHDKDFTFLIKTDVNGTILWRSLLNVGGVVSLIQTMDGGFAIAGADDNVTRVIKMDINREIEWSKTYSFDLHRSLHPQVSSIIQTSDNGFILLIKDIIDIIGDNKSWLSRYTVLKIDTSGTVQWSNSYLDNNPLITDLTQTTDGGVILIGTNSSGDWLFKLDEFGKNYWSKSFLDGSFHGAHIIQTSDNGFVIRTSPSSTFSSLLIKTDEYGNLEWDIHLPDFTSVSVPVQSSSNTLVVVGSLENDSTTNSHAIKLVKFDLSGNLLFENTFLIIGKNVAIDSFVQTTDQGFAFIEKCYEIYDYINRTAFITKINAEGEIQWNHQYIVEIKDDEWANALVETNDNGLVLAGITSSSISGPTDMWLVRTDKDGIELWNKSYGGSGDEVANAILQTDSGDFVVAGTTTSYGNGQSDMWLVKTDSNGIMKWSYVYGTSGKDIGFYLEETIDGGFILLGISYATVSSPGELLLVKTDALGATQWIKTYVLSEDFIFTDSNLNEFLVIGDHTSYAFYGKSILTRVISFLETSDGGFAIFLPYNHLLKLDENGVIQWKKKLDLGIGGISLEHYLSHNRVCLQETSDHGFIIGITDETMDINGGFGMIFTFYAGYLVKTDADGIIQWTKKCDDIHPHTIEAIFPVDDGIIAWIWFLGYLNISKIGLDGTWYWNYTSVDDDWTRGYSVWWSSREFSHASILLSTGSYATTGLTIVEDSPFHSTDAWLAKRAPNGSFLWKYTYGSTGSYNVFSAPVEDLFPFEDILTTNKPDSQPTIKNSDQNVNTASNSNGFELFPLFAGVLFIKWCTRRKNGGKKR